MAKIKTIFKRRSLNLKEKVKILDRLQNGEKVIIVARSLNLNESTIRTIRKSEYKIRRSYGERSAVGAQRVFRIQNPLMEVMEKHLINWIDDANKKNIYLDVNCVKEKALEIFNDLKKKDETYSSEFEFCASKGWFEKFKKRHSQVELIPTASSCTPESRKSVFALSKLSEGLQLGKALELFFTNNDPSSERSRIFQKQLEVCLAPYNELETQLRSKDQRAHANDPLENAPVKEETFYN